MLLNRSPLASIMKGFRHRPEGGRFPIANSEIRSAADAAVGIAVARKGKKLATSRPARMAIAMIFERLVSLERLQLRGASAMARAGTSSPRYIDARRGRLRRRKSAFAALGKTRTQVERKNQGVVRQIIVLSTNWSFSWVSHISPPSPAKEGEQGETPTNQEALWHGLALFRRERLGGLRPRARPDRHGVLAKVSALGGGFRSTRTRPKSPAQPPRAIKKAAISR